MTKYKKGDRVRIIRKVAGADDLDIGRVITLGSFAPEAHPEPLWQMTEPPYYWVCDDDVEPVDARPIGTVVTIDKPPTLPLRADEWEIVSYLAANAPPSSVAAPDPARPWWLVAVLPSTDETHWHAGGVWARRRQTKEGT